MITALALSLFFGLSFLAVAADTVKIDLDKMTVNGAAITDTSTIANTGESVIYYESGHDADYGESTDESEQHSAAEAAKVTVITITEPGTYEISGTLENSQLAVDLGDEAENDPQAVVTLILNNCNISNDIAPAVIFYNVYECGPTKVDNTETAQNLDTSKAGANVVIADDSENNITGSHVAKIYETDEHPKYKFDGAFYSKMTMNVNGEEKGNGILNIIGDNEGLDTEMHLTINGGIINIQSQDDGINTNEDGVSVTTINGGTLHITAGLGSEGDGIDSNGYLMINGGNVIALANSKADSGMDSDFGTLIAGGNIVALGSTMDDAEASSLQGTMNLKYSTAQNKTNSIIITDEAGNVIFAYDPNQDTTAGDNIRSYNGAVISCSAIEKGNTYHLYTGGTLTGNQTSGLYSEITDYSGGTQLSFNGNTWSGAPGGMEFDQDGRPTEQPEEAPEIPDGPQADGEDGPPALPDGDTGAQDGEDGPPALPDGDTGDTNQPVPPNNGNQDSQDESNRSYDFTMTSTATTFAYISTAVPGNGNNINGFTDVSSDAWYAEAIEYVTENDLMKGTSETSFEPNAQTTRGMLVTILWRMAGSPDTETNYGFTDLKADWYKTAVNWAAENDIVTGYDNQTFDPDDNVTREQTAAILYRYAQYQQQDVSATTNLDKYTDQQQISEYALNYMKWAVAEGYISGNTTTTLNPQGNTTRAEMATILTRYLK